MAADSTLMYPKFVYYLSLWNYGLMPLQLPCGLNGALYFSQMDADGGVVSSNAIEYLFTSSKLVYRHDSPLTRLELNTELVTVTLSALGVSSSSTDWQTSLTGYGLVR